jgi:hypothetical protein
MIQILSAAHSIHPVRQAHRGHSEDEKQTQDHSRNRRWVQRDEFEQDVDQVAI